MYKASKRVLEILISLLFFPFFILLIIYFFIRKLIDKKQVFIKKKYFLNEKENIDIKLINCENFMIRNLPFFYYIVLNKISLVGVALIEYRKNIDYKVNYKPGIVSLWLIRKNSKMTNSNISSSNKEYIQNRSLLYDIKIIFKSIITSLYSSKNKRHDENIKIFDVKFNNLKTVDVLDLFDSTIKNGLKKTVFYINADCLNKTFKDKEYKTILNKSDLVLADGSGINMACNILGKTLAENLNGTDMLPYVCDLAEKENYNIYFLGAEEGIAEKMSNELRKKYPQLNIVGCNHGFFSDEKEELEVIEKINNSHTNILFVALGAPYQEKFINKYKDQIDSNLIFAVGGLFDFYSNKIKRAPIYLRETGLEWIYRMIQEPKRMWRRYILGNPLFIYRVLSYKKDLLKEDIVHNYLENYTNESKFNFKRIFWKFTLSFYKISKRSIDFIASFILIVLFSPLFLSIATMIKLTSKGNVFFVQKRVGLNGKIFNMYKFRSMIVDAEDLKEKLAAQNESKDGVTFKMKDDPRITKIGKFIRKTSIDELPQLLNVLKGEMSLVGPRPPVINEVKQYNVDDKKRLNAVPGITCIWQVSGRSSIPFKEQVKMDKEYIKNQSLLKDIGLMLKTIPAVLLQRGSS